MKLTPPSPEKIVQFMLQPGGCRLRRREEEGGLSNGAPVRGWLEGGDFLVPGGAPPWLREELAGRRQR